MPDYVESVAEPYAEQPKTLIDQAASLVVLAGALVMVVWLATTIHLGDDRNHTPAFVGIASLAVLAVYMAWLVWTMRSLRYMLVGDELSFSQGWQHLNIALSPDRSPHLYRWRSRWLWSGGVQRDLGVTEVAVFPPVWFWKPSATWVLVYVDPKSGEKHAVAFRPTARLLNEIKAWVREAQATAI